MLSYIVARLSSDRVAASSLDTLNYYPFCNIKDQMNGTNFEIESRRSKDTNNDNLRNEEKYMSTGRYLKLTCGHNNMFSREERDSLAVLLEEACIN